MGYAQGFQPFAQYGLQAFNRGEIVLEHSLGAQPAVAEMFGSAAFVHGGKSGPRTPERLQLTAQTGELAAKRGLIIFQRT